MSPAGIATVARQEFTIRIRAGRWRWLLASWFVVLAVVTVLLRLAVGTVSEGDADNKGVVVYGGLTLLVLGLALLVVPTLGSQSINGDRERGTLATLQVTRLTAGDIAVGKLAAAWGTSLVFLALTLPLVGYCMTQGGVPFGRVVVVTLVVALLLGTVASISLCLSALLTRTSTSGILAYLAVFTLTIGTTMAFGLATALTTEEYEESNTCPTREELVSGGVPEQDVSRILSECSVSTFRATRARPDRVWWLLAPNPFVVLADSAPQLPPETAQERRAREEQERNGIYTEDLRQADPLGGLGRSVRELRDRPRSSSSAFSPSGSDIILPDEAGKDRKAVWPYGLAFNVALGAGALWLTTRQLRTPSRVLPRGQRVA